MNIWAIADLHLCLGATNKSMELFGPRWKNYMQRMEENWRASVHPEDLVLIAGDISWAMKLEQAAADFAWIESLPGTKVMIRGNHDYWWSSLSKVRAAMPPSMHALQNDAFEWQGVSIGGARLWDSSEYSFNQYIDFEGEPTSPMNPAEDERIFLREVERLQLSLQKLNQKASLRIVMTHYPPISADLQDSRVSKLLKEYHVDYCVFGHLHQVKEGISLFGKKEEVTYLLTASDYLHFKPIKIYTN